MAQGTQTVYEITLHIVQSTLVLEENKAELLCRCKYSQFIISSFEGWRGW